MNKMIPRPDLVHPNSPRGLEVFQLTTEAGVPACHVYMEAQVFTPDSRRLVLHRSCHAHGSDKNDPEHRYLLCDLDNAGELSPLTAETGVTAPSVSPDGRWLYYLVDETSLNGGRLTVKRVGLDGTGRETVCVIDRPLSGAGARLSRIYPLSTVSSDGKRLAFAGFLGDGKRANPPWGLVVVDLAAGRASLLLQGPTWCNFHPQYSRSLDPQRSHDLLLQENHGNETDPTGEIKRGVGGVGADIHVLSDDGGHFRDMPWGRSERQQCQGHQCWRGRSDVAISTAGFVQDRIDPERYHWGHEERILEGVATPHAAGHLGVGAPGVKQYDLSRGVEAPRFFHFATDLSGERFIVDANPRRPQGMDLFVARLGEPFKDPLLDCTFLLDTKTHFFDRGHPHPFLSPDGKTAFFNSTESGKLRAYMARGF